MGNAMTLLESMNRCIVMGSNPSYVIFLSSYFSNNLENNLSYLVSVNSQLMVFIATSGSVEIAMALKNSICC